MFRPTLTTLFALCVVFVVQSISGLVGLGADAFALALPLGHRSWTIVTSVYAHGGIAHLLANAIALVVVGPLVGRVTTPIRFHAFFLGTGATAGIAQVLLLAPFGGVAVLGASGAIFALFGYLLIGNRASDRIVSWLPLGSRGQLALFVGLAALVTLATAAPGVALVSHFVGFCLGAVAGRLGLLHVSNPKPRVET